MLYVEDIYTSEGQLSLRVKVEETKQTLTARLVLHDSLTHAPTYSCTHILTHPPTHAPHLLTYHIYSRTHILTPQPTHAPQLLMHPHTHAPANSSTHLLTHPPAHSPIYSRIHLLTQATYSRSPPTHAAHLLTHPTYPDTQEVRPSSNVLKSKGIALKIVCADEKSNYIIYRSVNLKIYTST